MRRTTPTTIWLRDDLAELLRQERNMTALVNNLLAKHYGKEPTHTVDPIRDFARLELCLTPLGANAVLAVQKLKAWSRDHVFEVSIREHLGLPPTDRVRLTRRVATKVPCQMELSISHEAYNAAKERYPAFATRAAGHLVSPWLIATSQRLAEEMSGL